MKGNAKRGEARERLAKAAIDIFNKRGFTATSTRMIIQKAKITKPTLYYYFKNKENLYREVIRDIFKHFNDQLSSIADGPSSPFNKLVQVVSLYLEDATRKPEEMRLFMMTLYQCDISTPRITMERYVLPGLQSISRIIKECIKGRMIEPDDPLKLSLRLIGIIHIQVLMLIKGLEYLPRSQPEDIALAFMKSGKKHNYLRR